MKKIISLLTLIAIISMASLPAIEPAKAATTGDVTVTATVSSAISLSVSSGTASLSLTPGATPATATTTLTATSNDSSGYNLSIKSINRLETPTADLSLLYDIINTIVASASSAVATNSNKWGVYVSTAPEGATIDEGYDNDTTSDAAISTSDDMIGNHNAAAVSGENWVVTYTGAVNTSLPSGAYTTTITYTITAGVV